MTKNRRGRESLKEQGASIASDLKPTWCASAFANGRTGVAAAVGEPRDGRIVWTDGCYLGDRIEVGGRLYPLASPDDAALAAVAFACLHGSLGEQKLIHTSNPVVGDVFTGKVDAGELGLLVRTLLLGSGSDVVDVAENDVEFIFGHAGAALLDGLREERDRPAPGVTDGSPQEQAAATAVFDDPARRKRLSLSQRAILSLEKSGKAKRIGFRRNRKRVVEVVWAAACFFAPGTPVARRTDDDGIER